MMKHSTLVEVMEYGLVAAIDEEGCFLVTVNGSYFNLWVKHGDDNWENTDCCPTDKERGLYGYSAAQLLDDAKEQLAYWMNPKGDPPEIGDVFFSVKCEGEDEQIEGNASAVDPVTDAKVVARIRKQLAAGNQWAWCSVTVLATWTDRQGVEHEGVAHLGACSYASERQFRRDGYFKDMKKEAFEDLLRNFERS